MRPGARAGADRGEAVTEDELAVVFRRAWMWWPGDEPVTAEHLRELAGLTGRAARAMEAGREVGRADVEERAAAEAAGRAAAHLDGSAVLSVAWQQVLVMQLLAGPERHRNVTAARQLLMAAGGDLLRRLGSDRFVATRLLRAFPPDDEVWEVFLAARLEGGGHVVAAGLAERLALCRLQAFTPELIDPGLAGLPLADLAEGEVDQAGRVLAAVSDDAVLTGLAGLSPVQRARARRWLSAARQAVANVGEVRGHLSGDPARRVPPERLPVLVRQLAQGAAPQAALRLLRASADGELTSIFAGGAGMAEMLEEAIPVGHRLAAELEGFLLERSRPDWWQGRDRRDGRWADRVRRHHSGALDAHLTAAQQGTLARILLSGTPARGNVSAVMLLLANADDADLGVIFTGRGLLGLLDAAGAADPEVRGLVRDLLDERFDGGRASVAEGLVRPRGLPALTFEPRMIGPSLAGIAVTDRPAEHEVRRVAQVIAGLSGADLGGLLRPLPPVQRARAAWWLGLVRAGQVDSHLSGDPAAELTERQQRDLAVRLATGFAALPERRAALRLLDAASDDQLGRLFAGGGLLTVLDEGIPPGHELRGELDQFIARRFAGGRRALTDGDVRPLRHHPAAMFAPRLVHASLAGLGPGDLAEEHLERLAAALAQARFERWSAASLPPVQAARGRRWLGQVRAAIRAVRYLSGDPVHDLPAGEQAEVIGRLVAGPGRWAALRLLRAADDDQLRVIFAGGPGLLRVLDQGLAGDPVLRGQLDDFLAARFGEAGLGSSRDAVLAGEVHPHGQPAARFTPGLISPELADAEVEDELTGEQRRHAQGAILGRPDSELALLLAGLPPVQRARAAWWLRRARAAAGWAARGLAYLSGDPSAGLSAGELAELVVALVTGRASPPERALALVLLQAAGDAELQEMFAGGELARVLAAGIEEGQARQTLERFYEHRFEGGQEAVAAGSPRARAVYPQAEFRPELIGAGMAGLPVGRELTSGQARAALLGRPDAELEEALAPLPPARRAVAAWWLGRARAAARWQDRALAYLTGDPAASLAAGELGELVEALTSGLASPAERWLALQLLRSAGQDEVTGLFDGTGHLAAVLEAGIPRGHSLRGELESVLERGFEGGLAALAAGQAIPLEGPRGEFTPGLLSPSLQYVDESLDLTAETIELTLVMAVLAGLNGDDLSRVLALPGAQQARAARWLAGVRVAVHATGAGPAWARSAPILAMLDDVLDALYRAAALDVPDAGRLRQVTVRPPDAAARPSASGSPGQARPFLDRIPGQADDFAARLHAAYLGYIEHAVRGTAARYGAAVRAIPGNLYPMDHIGQIAVAASTWTDETFGHLAAGPALVPDRPGIRGNIHDQYADADQEIASMSPAERRDFARQHLLEQLITRAQIDTVVREHHADPLFNSRGEPQNQEARIFSAVIGRLVHDDAVLAQVLELYRRIPGRAWADTQDIWVQVVRAPEAWRNQVQLWEILQTMLHEGLHLREHPDYRRYRDGLGGQARDALVEGVVSLLTEIAWRGIAPRAGDAEVRGVVEGEYAIHPPLPPDRMPHPAISRYPSMAEVMRLVHVVGDIRNLYAAFFLGEVEQITGPIGLAVMGSPRAPLAAGEIAALVVRLNALPAADRHQLQISVFAGADQADIERLLTEPGADVPGHMDRRRPGGGGSGRVGVGRPGGGGA